MRVRQSEAESDASFLLWAEHLKFITRAQSKQIWRERQNYVECRIQPPAIQQIADDMKLLSLTQVWEIEESHARKNLPPGIADPLQPFVSKKPNRSIPATWIAGLVMIVMLTITAVTQNSVIGAAAICSVVWLIIKLFDPLIDTRRTVLSKVARGFVRVFEVTVFVCTFDQFISPRPLLPAELPGLSVSTGNLFVGGLLVAFAALAARFAFRRLQISYLAARITLMRALRIAFGRSARQSSSGQNTSLSDILTRTARIVRLNPWDWIVRKFFLWDGSVGTVTVCLFQPSACLRGQFDMVASAVIGGTDEIRLALAEIANRYHPHEHDAIRFKQAIELCRERRFNAGKFLELFANKDFTSIVGYTFAQRQGVYSSDAKMCILRDMAYHWSVPEALKTAAVIRWMDYRSFVCLPVFLPDEHLPVAALLAFKTEENAFTPDDNEALILAAQIIGDEIAKQGDKHGEERPDAPVGAKST